MAKYKFEDIAFNSKEKKKPTPADKNTYLGLEHLDSQCLQVTRFGSDVAPVGEKLIMRQGDVLFGKRRAYQRKVAIAPFDGIFSAHGMVLRPKTKVIIKELFPFFISSNQFLDAAIKVSVGSLSPTINWRDLKVLEFDIPPLEEQAALAEILWGFEKTKAAYKRLLASTEALVQAQFVEMFGDPEGYQMWPTKKIKDVAKIKVGVVIQPARYYTDAQHGVKAFRSLNIKPFSIDNSDWVYFSEEGMTKNKRTIAQQGDVLIVRSGAPGTACVVTNEFSGCNVIDLIIASPREGLVDPLFLCAFTNFPHGKNKILAGQRGIAQKHFNIGMYENLDIPCPPIQLQKQFCNFFEIATCSKSAIQQSLSTLDQARSALMEKTFR